MKITIIAVKPRTTSLRVRARELISRVNQATSSKALRLTLLGIVIVVPGGIVLTSIVVAYLVRQQKTLTALDSNAA